MSDVVWICAHVEQMAEHDEYVSIPRDEWEAMSPAEQEEFLTDAALAAMANAGGCGASVIDAADVPEEFR